MSKPIVVIACMLSSSESWEPQTAPTSLALACRWRSRPQHHFRTHAVQQTDAILDEFQPFRIQLWEKEGRSCDVSARACDTLYKTSGHGIARYSHDDGNGRSRPLGCKSPRGTVRHDHPYVEANKLGGKLRQLFVFAFSPSVLKYDVLPLDISEIAQPLPERIEMLRSEEHTS